MALFLMTTSACSASHDAGNEAPLDRSVYGFAVGDSLRPLAVDCLGAGPRTLATVGTTQVITFSTPGDCSTCMPHLAGLDSLAQEARGPADNVIVTYVPGQSIATIARLYGARRARDICVDTSGAAWDALHIEKTPVTVLLVSGRVVLLTNRGLLSDSSRRRFAAELAAGQRAER